MSRRAFAISIALLSACAQARATTAPGTTALAPAAAPATAPVNASEPPATVVAEPSNASTTWVGAEAASDFVLATQREQLVGVWVDVPKATGPRVPMAIALTIDTSGSMSGDPIAHARQAARKVVESLEDGDLLSLVTFDTSARVLIEPTIVGPQTRKRAIATISELDASGGTALHDGVKAAEMVLLQAPETYLVRRVIVLSDGQATNGPTSPAVLGNLAEVGMSHGIQVTALGVGLEYDEATLDAFAVRSSGRLYHIESSKALPEIVQSEMDLLASTTAAAAELEVVPAQGVEIVGVDAVRSTGDHRGLRVPLGVMFAGQQREVLVRVRIDSLTAGEHALASVRLKFRDPRADGVERVQESLLRATVTEDPRLVAAHENQRAQAIIATREAALLAARASEKLGQGDLVAAAAELERGEADLRRRASKMGDTREKAQVLSNAETMKKTKAKVDAAAKAPAARRASASRAAALDANDAMMALDGF